MEPSRAAQSRALLCGALLCSALRCAALLSIHLPRWACYAVQAFGVSPSSVCAGQGGGAGGVAARAERRERAGWQVACSTACVRERQAMVCGCAAPLGPAATLAPATADCVRAPCRCIGVRRMTMVAPRSRCAVRGARAAVLLPRSAGPRVHEHTYVCSCAYSAAASGRFSADTSPCSECARWLRMLCMPPKAPPPLGKATNSSMLCCKSSVKPQL